MGEVLLVREANMEFIGYRACRAMKPLPFKKKRFSEGCSPHIYILWILELTLPQRTGAGSCQ